MKKYAMFLIGLGRSGYGQKPILMSFLINLPSLHNSNAFIEKEMIQ